MVMKVNNVVYDRLANSVTSTDLESHNKRYLMSIFENFEIFAAFKRESTKLSYDTRICQLLTILEKIVSYFLLYPLYLTCYFAQ